MEKSKIIIREVALTLIIALVLSLLLQRFVIEARMVPTGSMLPTIKINQRVLINKMIYKFRPPQRGEIIIFKPPIKLDNEKDYIKRVIGVAGDIVEIKNGLVYVNNKPLQEKYIYEKPLYDFGPVEVPKNCFFVLGDNRNKSYDSHMWDYWLSIDNIKGKAFLTYWPFKKIGIDMEVTSENIGNK